MRNAILTEQAPKPIGPYSQAIIEGDFIFVAGQGPINPGTGSLELGDVRAETKRVFENLRAILQAAGSSLEHGVGPQEGPITSARQHAPAQPRTFERSAHDRRDDTCSMRHGAEPLRRRDDDLERHEQT